MCVHALTSPYVPLPSYFTMVKDHRSVRGIGILNEVAHYLSYLGISTVDLIDCLCVLDNHRLLADDEIIGLT